MVCDGRRCATCGAERTDADTKVAGLEICLSRPECYSSRLCSLIKAAAYRKYTWRG